MRLHTILAIACSVLAVYARECPPTEVLFLIDQSENAARLASSSSVKSPFQYLKDAVRMFLSNPVVARASNFRIGLIGYSSRREENTRIPIGITPAQALNYVDNISNGIYGGSWTFTGLKKVNVTPAFPNNLLLVLSSQGSGTVERRGYAQQEMKRVTDLGWKVNVIGLQGYNEIDMEELTIVNNGKRPVILQDSMPYNPKDPKLYKELTGEFLNIINNKLCTVTTTTTTTTTTTLTRAP